MAGYKQLKLVIVEDEWVISLYIKNIIQNHFENIIICEECQSVDVAVKAINKHLPDIVLFDIELLDGDCFDVISKVENNNFQKLFITSYSEYALKAIKLHAVDYHLKPINEKELVASIKRCIENVERDEIVRYAKLNIESESFKKNVKEKSLVINKKNETLLIEYSKILYIMSDNSYTKIFYLNKKNVESIISSISIKKMEEILPENYFLRIHNRYIINTSYFKSIDGSQLNMEFGIAVPISNDKAKLLKTKIL